MEGFVGKLPFTEKREPGQGASKLAVTEATEIAELYNFPQSLVSVFFVKYNDVLYPKEPFLLMQGHKRGIQAIEVTRPESHLLDSLQGEQYHEYQCEARIFPKVDKQILFETLKLPAEERRELLAYLTKPTVEWGKASLRTVRMSTMHEYLPEIAIKRAVCRALRLFVGIGLTSWEEMPMAEVSQNELKQSGYKIAETS